MSLNPFRDVMNEKVSLIKQNNQRFDDIIASVGANSIMIDDASLLIDEGDKIIRTLSNGIIETYIVIDRGYQEQFFQIPAHYQVKVCKVTAMSNQKITSSLLREFNDITDDVISSNDQSFDNNIQRLFVFLADETSLDGLISTILPTVDFDTWYTSALENSQLNWPKKRLDRVAMQLELLRRIANEEINWMELGLEFLVVDARLDVQIEAIVKQIFKPFYRDLTRIIEPYVLREQDDMPATKESGTVHIHFSGTVQNSILNIQSTLANLSQTINASPNIESSTKTELRALVDQLTQELQQELQQQPSPEKAEEAEAVAEYAKILVEAATKGKPNKPMITISAEGLKKAAENVAQAMPTVLPIAMEIANKVHMLFPQL